MSRPLVWLPLLGLLVILALASLAWAGSHALTDSADLDRRAIEASLFLRTVDPYQTPDLTYPPSALPVFTALVAPFGPASLHAAWLAINLLATGALCAGVLWLWAGAWPGWVQVAFCLAVVASKPLRAGIGLGQFHLLPLVALVGSLVALRCRRSVVAGVLVGLALVKPTMAVPWLGYLVARRQWRALAAAALTQAGLLAVTCAWLGIGPVRLLREWAANARLQEAAGVIDVPSLLARVWPSAPGGAISLAILLLVLGMTWRLRDRSDLALVSFCSFVAAVFSYHRPYDLVLLLVPLALAVDEACKAAAGQGRGKVLFALAVGALLVWPKHRLVLGPLEAVYDPVFIVLAYAWLAFLVYDLVASKPSLPTPAHAARPRVLGRAQGERVS